MLTRKRAVRQHVLFLVSLVAVAGMAAAQPADEPFAPVPAEQRSAINERIEAFVEAYRRSEWFSVYELVSEAGRRGISEKDFGRAMSAGDKADGGSYHLIAFRPVRTVQIRKNVYNVFGCVGTTRNKANKESVGAMRAVFEHNAWFFTNWVLADGLPPCAQLSEEDWKPVNSSQLEEPMLPLTCYVNACAM